MNRAPVDRPIYSGAPWLPYAQPGPHGNPGHGFCPSCCHPRSKCCCCRECRKEARELLVQPQPGVLGQLTKEKLAADQRFIEHLGMVQPFFKTRMQDFPAESTGEEGGESGIKGMSTEQIPVQVVPARRYEQGYAKAFIGGGCCVHLSIEYAPSSPTATSAVAVLVQGADDTTLAWMKVEQPGAGYQVKEGIIATQPGADLAVIVINATARVRWCEIFSC